MPATHSTDGVYRDTREQVRIVNIIPDGTNSRRSSLQSCTSDTTSTHSDNADPADTADTDSISSRADADDVDSIDSSDTDSTLSFSSLFDLDDEEGSSEAQRQRIVFDNAGFEEQTSRIAEGIFKKN